jgi:predicted short-subunit dehydrogenase-like oxidoreductase (DUF2520 family)
VNEKALPARAGIVGAGQAGAALGHGLVRAGVNVVAVMSRTGRSAESLAAALGARAVADLGAVGASAELVVLAVPDDVLAGVAAALPARYGHKVLHCSGAVGMEVLDPARDAGASVGVLHPVTPLVPPAAPETLAGKPMGIEAAGDPGWIVALACALGGVPVSLAGVDRPLYHAAAAMSANLVVAMCATAVEVFERAGLSRDDAETLVGSLVTATARNVATRGPVAALTGPVRRGDAEVLDRHIKALARLEPDVLAAYKAASRRILAIMPEGEAKQRSSSVLGVAGR